ncbi:MAG: deoxynucleoside kinase [Flavobacteriales bacterium]|nr:deoxynucleoside kinase [Flavobacteriales bacterium]
MTARTAQFVRRWSMYDFIAIEGNIGAGKTTLANLLSDDLDSKLILEEFADNPFLPKFYKEPEKHAFPLELFFLAERYHQLKSHFASPDLFKQSTVSDYFIGKSLIFAKTNLMTDELRLFRNLYDIMFSNLPKPDLLIYLHLDTEDLQKNIRKRGRDYEQKIEDTYLERVQQSYLEFLRQQEGLRTVILSMKNIDFVGNISHFVRIKEVIQRNFPTGLNFVDLSEDI